MVRFRGKPFTSGLRVDGLLTVVHGGAVSVQSSARIMEPIVDDQPHEIVARFDSTLLANVNASTISLRANLWLVHRSFSPFSFFFLLFSYFFFFFFFVKLNASLHRGFNWQERSVHDPRSLNNRIVATIRPTSDSSSFFVSALLSVCLSLFTLFVQITNGSVLFFFSPFLFTIRRPWALSHRCRSATGNSRRT